MGIYKISKLVTVPLTLVAILIFVALTSGCPGKLAPTPPATNYISNSEVAEAIASGVVTATYSGGSEARYVPKTPKAVALRKIVESYLSLMPRAEAALTQGQCASVQTGNSGVFAPNSVCGAATNAANALQTMTLTWAPCNGAAPLGTWSGGTNLSLIASPGGTTFTCLGFPGFQAGDVVTRSFFSPSGRINNASIDPLSNQPWNPLTGQDLVGVNSPVTVLVDTYGATQIPTGTAFTSLPSNYPTNGYSGWAFVVPTVGETITFTGPVDRTITVNGIHLKSDVGGYITWDFTVSTAFYGTAGTPLTLDGANNLNSGALYVQDNINKVVTLTTFAGPVTYVTGCGVPTGGTATTAVVAGYGSYTGETLAFTGSCGTATLNGTQMYLFHSF